MIKHCSNCEGFCWWDGDYTCTIKMKIIQHSPDGKYSVPLAKLYDASKCEDYLLNDYDNWYEKSYVEFLIEYYELPYTYDDKDKILNILGYK